ncbi:acyl-CoA thioesterase [Fluviicola sp.]|jgi:acyl-CoA thioester hydrolase|uniref:acyl-CoA thioesterase n=1 Tax=Fluviicola sp. TaxID=1917219 RepID=UPI00283269C3|nr:acyl-CoA thioesterase [Fluviicola sp.]MDR0801463.1 acyl-CoA thioesterase [Fluviicola sp.]
MKKILKSSILVPVRFSETDAMGIVWHGNYLKFFEDAREQFGKDYGIEYLDVYEQGYFIPIVKSEISHKASIFYGEQALVNVILEQRDSAKIVFHYEVINNNTGQIAATGMTIQVFMFTTDRTLELIKPEFYRIWEEAQNWLDE